MQIFDLSLLSSFFLKQISFFRHLNQNVGTNKKGIFNGVENKTWEKVIFAFSSLKLYVFARKYQ